MEPKHRTTTPPGIRPGIEANGSRPSFDELFAIPVRRRRGRVFIGLLAVLAVLAGTHALAASAVTADDLRGDIPTGDSLRDELAEIADARASRLAGLTSTEAKLADVLFRRESLDEDQRRLAAEIEAATSSLKRLAVEAFITGGDLGSLEFLASVNGANDFAWRQYLVRSHAGSATIAVERLRGLRESADDLVIETIAQAEELRTEIEVHELALDEIADRIEEIEAVMPLAEAWDRAAIAIAEGQWGIAPTDKWERLRLCESTHDYGAISPSGLYRGAYQFDIPTWQTVGGTGDPASAPPAEQDARARELYARRGAQPWPVCGRYLE